MRASLFTLGTCWLALTACRPSAPAPVAESPSRVSVLEDDYEAARALAEQTNRLLVVDAWAPWCHTCVFFREHVQTRPAFKAFEQDVVFAAVDTERTQNAVFLEKFPVKNWPTFFFIHPKTQQVLVRWVGSADETQMKELIAAAKKGGNMGGLSQVAADALDHKDEACARGALALLPSLTHAVDRVAALTWGVGCALEWKDPANQPAVMQALVTRSHAELGAADVPADDVSCLYEVLVQRVESTQDKPGVQRLAEQWMAFLEKHAAAATSSAQRAVFDTHRVVAALALGQPQRAVPALEQSQKDFPADYNPPARLAILRRELGKLPEALADADRALSLCKQGPRCIRLHETRASILLLQGDKAAQRAALEAALKFGRALPASQQPQKKLAALETALAKKD